MKNKTLSLLIMTLLLASCMPDSLTKYKEDSKKTASTNTGSSGGSSGGSGSGGSTTVVTVPTTFTCNNSSTHRFYVGTAITELTTNTNGSGGLSYSISPSAPFDSGVSGTGLSFSTTSGAISGTPTVAIPETTFTIELRQNGVVKKTCALKLSAATKLSAGDLFIGQENGDKLILEIADAAQFSDDEHKGSYLVGATGPGEEEGYGVLNRIDGKELYVSYDDSLLSSDEADLLEAAFLKGSSIGVDSDAFGFSEELAEISKVTYVKATTDSFILKPRFLSSLGLSEPETGMTFTLTRIAETVGGVTYTPPTIVKLATGVECTSVPSDGKVYYNATNGEICGDGTPTALNTFNPGKYLLTVRNANKESIGFEFYLSVQETPAALSSGEFLLLTMTSTSKFKRGMQVSGTCDKIIPPASSYNPDDESRGIVKEIVSNTRMIVKVTKRNFEIESSCANSAIPIDNKIPYSGEAAKATAVKAITGSLIFADGAAANLAEGDVITTASGARGVVVHSADLTTNSSTATYGSYGPTYDKIYVKVTEGSFSTGDTIVGLAAPNTVIAVDFPNIKIAVANSASFKRGHEVTAQDAAPFGDNNSAGTVTTKDGNTLHVESHYDFFKSNENLDNANPFSATEQVISSVSSDTHYNLYLGREAYIKLDLLKGNNIKFDLEGDLPAGLSIDLETLSISGTPTDNTETGERRAFVLYAYNGTNTDALGIAPPASHSFTIQIHNHLTIGYDTAASKTSRYLFHRAKYGNKTRSCTITEDMIDLYVNDGEATSSIDCFMDAEELELFHKGVTLTAEVGGGLCNSIVYEPYSIYQFPAGYSVPSDINLAGTTHSRTEKCYLRHEIDGGAFPLGCSNLTAGTMTVDTDCNGVFDAADDLVAVTPKCAYDYSSDPQKAVNCDEGSYLETTIRWTGDGGASPGACDDTDTRSEGASAVSQNEVECNGVHQQCLKGAITDMYSSVQDRASKIGEIVFSEDGLTGVNKKLWTIAAPNSGSKSHRSNVGIANYAANNSCISVDEFDYDSQNWKYANLDALDSSGLYEKFEDPFHGANPVYTFRCVDGAGSTKANVNLFIREFDKSFSLDDDLDLFLGDGLTLLDDLEPFRAGHDGVSDIDPITGRSLNDVGSIQDLFSSDLGCPTPASMDAEASGTKRYDFPGTGL